MASRIPSGFLLFILVNVVTTVTDDTVSAVNTVTDDTVSEEEQRGTSDLDTGFYDHVQPEQMEALKESAAVLVAVFDSGEVESEPLNYPMYRNAARILSQYNMPFVVVECRTPETDRHQVCQDSDAGLVYFYRYSELVVNLYFDELPSVRHFVYYSLLIDIVHTQRVGAHIQEKDQLRQMMQDMAGQEDVILTFSTSVNRELVRVLEVAHAYIEQYKFCIIHEVNLLKTLPGVRVVSEPQTFSLFILRCKDWNSDALGCRSIQYKGENSLSGLSAFFRRLSSWPAAVLYRSDSEGQRHPCEREHGAVCAYIYYSHENEQLAVRTAQAVQFQFQGMAGIIVQQRDKEERSADSGHRDPTLVVKTTTGDYLTMTDAWQLIHVSDFISTHLRPSPPADKAKKHRDDDDGDVDDEKGRAYLKKMNDDMVAYAANQLREDLRDPPSNILALTDKTFPVLVSDSSESSATDSDSDQDLLVVLFYLPFDAQSQLFLTVYSEAGKDLAQLVRSDDPTFHPLAMVSCFDWPQVCQKENVTRYPEIYFYRNNRERQKYMHALDRMILISTIMLVMYHQPLQLLSADEVERFVEGSLPANARFVTDNFVLLRMSPDARELDAYLEVVQVLETEMAFAIIDHGVATPIFTEVGVLHVRLTDKHRSFEMFTDNLDAPSIIAFLRRTQFHLLPELTVVNLPNLYARHQSFGILFLGPSDAESTDHEQAVVDVITGGHFPDLLFCKMSMDGSNSVARALLTRYSEDAVLPAFVIVSHHQGTVHVRQGEDLTEMSLVAWIKDVEQGKVPVQRSLTKEAWKPVGRPFNFLAKMDRYKRRREANGTEDEERCREVAPEDRGPGVTLKMIEQPDQKPSEEPQMTQEENQMEEMARRKLLKVRLCHAMPLSGECHPEEDKGGDDLLPEENNGSDRPREGHLGEGPNGKDGQLGEGPNGKDGQLGEGPNGKDGQLGEGPNGKDGQLGEGPNGKDGQLGEGPNGKDGQLGEGPNGKDGQLGEGPNGKDGQLGEGPNGKDGQLGEGPNGKDGQLGEGPNGKDGQLGEGPNGKDGQLGEGPNGKDGQLGEGPNGKDGQLGEGPNGKDGQLGEGPNGKDGQLGEGPNGKDGQLGEGPNGKDGQLGEGPNGKDGQLGEGPNGKDGQLGEGPNGKDGQLGEGPNGKDGQLGEGPNGKDGQLGEGPNGKDGQLGEGPNGKDGQLGEGPNGKDGQLGEGPNGKDGQLGEGPNGKDGQLGEGPNGKDGQLGEGPNGKDGQLGEGPNGKDGQLGEGPNGKDGQLGEGPNGKDGQLGEGPNGKDGQLGEGPNGKDGQLGEGPNGKDGQLGEGPNGKDGQLGEGPNGKDGQLGEGPNGKDGQLGEGPNGKDGQLGEGPNGKDGQLGEGPNGKDGQLGEGPNGKDGQLGEGPNGKDGQLGEGPNGKDGQQLDAPDSLDTDGEDKSGGQPQGRENVTGRPNKINGQPEGQGHVDDHAEKDDGQLEGQYAPGRAGKGDSGDGERNAHTEL